MTMYKTIFTVCTCPQFISIVLFGRAVARALIGGLYIHIFVLCRLISFEMSCH